MTEDRELVERKLLVILEEAITEEKMSTARYRNGARLAADPQLIAMFEKLADDEVEHEKALKQRYYEIKKRLGFKVVSDGEPDAENLPE